MGYTVATRPSHERWLQDLDEQAASAAAKTKNMPVAAEKTATTVSAPHALLPFRSKLRYAMGSLHTYVCERTHKQLSEMSISPCPVLTADILTRYLNYFVRIGAAPPHPAR